MTKIVSRPKGEFPQQDMNFNEHPLSPAPAQGTRAP